MGILSLPPATSHSAWVSGAKFELGGGVGILWGYCLYLQRPVTQPGGVVQSLNCQGGMGENGC